jgi:predicted site-specific integrase-resolvase
VNVKKVVGASLNRDAVLYARVSTANKEYIENLASEYDISLSRVVNDVFDRIRENNAS